MRKFIKERSEIEKGSRAESKDIAKMATAKSSKREREMAESKHSLVSSEGKGSETRVRASAMQEAQGDPPLQIRGEADEAELIHRSGGEHLPMSQSSP